MVLCIYSMKMATIKVNTTIIILTLYTVISYCTGTYRYMYGMKSYTFVLDRIASQGAANNICKNTYSSTLAVIIDTATLEQFNDWLFSLRGEFHYNRQVHELWTGGKSNEATGTYLQQSQPLETGNRCLLLSNHTYQNLKGYNLYAKDCSYNRHFVCEKTREIESHSETFGSFPSFDSKVRKFDDHNQRSMISAVTVYAYKDDVYQYISCIAFTYGYEDLPCRGDHVVQEQAHILQLYPSEYITEISGEHTWAVIQITFKTNLQRSLTVGEPLGFGRFHASKNGAPLMYVSGSAGTWLYQLQYHFFYKSVDQLQEVSDVIASNVYNAINDAQLEKLINIKKQYQHMLPDVANRGCNLYLFRNNSNYLAYKAGCELKYLLGELNVYATSTNALKKHLPRNLMNIADYKSEILLAGVTEAKEFHKLIKNITFTTKEVGSVIQNTVKSVNQDVANNLNRYFTSVAEFDKDIAQADRGYITKKLEKLKDDSDKLMDELSTRIKVVLWIAQVFTGVDTLESGIKVLISLFEINPLNLFSGISELSTARRKATHALRLLTTLPVYAKYMEGLSNKFAANKEKTSVMRTIIQKYPDANDAEQLAEHFVKTYTDYSPQVSSHDFVYAAELLSAVIEEGCGLIDGATGTVSNTLLSYGHLVEIPVTLARKEPSTICTELKPLLSKLKAMYESVFNFQFELIDSFTRIVQSNVAKEMAKKISDIKEVKHIDLQTAAIGSLMVDIRCQAVAHARCQELEYLNGGNRPKICRHIHFTDSMMDKIIAFKGTIDSSVTKNVAFIPMTPSSTDNSAPYLDVADLIANNVTSFQLPLSNKQWLVKYKWLENYFHAENNKQTSYYISGLEMFIPGLKCKGLDDYALRIDITSGKNVKLYSEEAPPTYVIPEALYKFIYKKTQICPRAEQMVNFEVRKDDADLTSDHAQLVCVLSEGETETSLLPSLYSTWIIKLLTPQGCDPVIDSSMEFTPLITVRFRRKDVVAADTDPNQCRDECMHECWPPHSRCDRNERCVDGILSYMCQLND